MEIYLNNIPLLCTLFLRASTPARISSKTPLKDMFSVPSIIVLKACILLKSAFFNK